MLTLIITCLNDGPELSKTLQSIHNTASDQVKIIVIDDQSGTPLTATCREIKLADLVIRNRFRMGVGPSRHIGIFQAQTRFVLFCDSHMAFPAGWLDKALTRLEAHPQTIFSPICIGLDRDHQQLENPASLYHGAFINFSGPDPQNPKSIQVLEPNWNKRIPADNEEIGCVLGGAYFCSREWFLHLSALKYLRIWGSDEPALSLASWLCGGDCRLITEFGIGHRYSVKGERQKWDCPMGAPTYNKLFVLHAFLPEDYAHQLRLKLEATTDRKEFALACSMVQSDWRIFESERLRFASLAKRTFSDYKQRFAGPF